MRCVVIMVPAEVDSTHFIQQLGLKPHAFTPNASMASMLAYSGKMQCLNRGVLRVHLVRNNRNVDDLNSTATTTSKAVLASAAILAFLPDVVISAGTAIGLGSLGAQIGDVYYSTKCIFHDSSVPAAEKCASIKRYLNNGGEREHRSSTINALLHGARGLKQGVVSTSDRPSDLFTSEDLQVPRDEGAAVSDTEAAACAWACQALGTQFLAVNSIAAVADGNDQLARNVYDLRIRTGAYNLASANLQDKLSEVLYLLGNAPLSKWRQSSLSPKYDCATSTSDVKKRLDLRIRKISKEQSSAPRSSPSIVEVGSASPTKTVGLSEHCTNAWRFYSSVCRNDVVEGALFGLCISSISAGLVFSLKSQLNFR
mmetsp:Transcript_13908/g.23533  ORF Transcript_13908/g.23533 Transcript_13908/m.23533 type:complete len:369 (+) Transcript_13908:287-1393(+)